MGDEVADGVYRKLADRLNAIPNGFEPAESGLRLLAKLFTEEEAEIASVMRMSSETPASIAARVNVDIAARVEVDIAARVNVDIAAQVKADIAARSNVDEDQVRSALEAMARKGLVRSARSGDEAAYGLMPFVVGIYEESLPRMDEELASLFEEYYRETAGGTMTHGGPALHRVIPVGESVPVDLEIFPYERASDYIENAKSWGVRDCICRVQQKLVGKGCNRPIENCLIFAPVENAFEDSDVTRPISKEESLRILRESADAGLVHSTMNQKGQIFYICNCCTCCCGILRGVKEFGIPTAVARSDFHVVVDANACAACVACVERCQFEALSVDGDVCVVDYDRCVGCGVCVSHCSFDAMMMERRPEGELPEPPADRRDWLTERADARGIALSDIE